MLFLRVQFCENVFTIIDTFYLYCLNSVSTFVLRGLFR
jgi:hypothetical protein